MPPDPVGARVSSFASEFTQLSFFSKSDSSSDHEGLTMESLMQGADATGDAAAEGHRKVRRARALAAQGDAEGSQARAQPAPSGSAPSSSPEPSPQSSFQQGQAGPGHCYRNG